MGTLFCLMPRTQEHKKCQNKGPCKITEIFCRQWSTLFGIENSKSLYFGRSHDMQLFIIFCQLSKFESLKALNIPYWIYQDKAIYLSKEYRNQGMSRISKDIWNGWQIQNNLPSISCISKGFLRFLGKFNGTRDYCFTLKYMIASQILCLYFSRLIIIWHL